MRELDLKDKKILYHLDLDSRQSFAQIGKKVGLHRNNVRNRIEKLKKLNIIEDFHTVVDPYSMGQSWYRIYITYQFANLETQKEIINYFVDCKYTIDVHSTKGSYDLIIIMSLDDIKKFNNFWEKTLNKYGKYFNDQVLSIFSSEVHYDLQFILKNNHIKSKKRDKTVLFNSAKVKDIEDIDCNIIKIICNNSRMLTTDIAHTLKVTPQTIKNRINNLQKKGVIKRFRVGINLPKIGYHVYKVDIALHDRACYNDIISYLEKNIFLASIIKTIGYVDLEICFYLENQDHLMEIIDNLYKNFPNCIKNYKYFTVFNTHKWRYMPEKA